MALLKATSPRQLLKATPGLQAYWKLRVNLFERASTSQTLGGMGGMMIGGGGHTGGVTGGVGGGGGGQVTGGGTMGMTGVGGVIGVGGTTVGGQIRGTSMQGGLMVGGTTGGGPMHGGVIFGIAQVGGAMVGGVTTVMGWLTGTLLHPSAQVHGIELAATRDTKRTAKIAFFIFLIINSIENLLNLY